MKIRLPSGGTPVAGQQLEYAFDNTGNRNTASRDGDHEWIPNSGTDSFLHRPTSLLPSSGEHALKVCGEDTAKGAVSRDINKGWQGGELGGELTPRARKICIEYAGAAQHVIQGHPAWATPGPRQGG